MAFTTSRIPFAERKGLEVWPNGARIAVLVYVAAEQWNWGEEEQIRPAGTMAAGRNSPSTASTQTAVDYGFNVGLPRIGQIFRDFGMRTTMFSSAVSFERFPDIMKLLASEHEIGGHGYTQQRVIGWMPPEEQERTIQRCIETIEQATGERPTGWISPAAESTTDTVEILAANGFDYHGDRQDDELPYFMHVGDRTMVEIPYRLVGNLNDLSLLVRNYNSVSDALQLVTDSFDAYYEAAAERPLMFNYGTHPYISGRPEGSKILRRFLEHIHAHDDVWVTNYSAISQWWRQRYEAKIVPGEGRIDIG